MNREDIELAIASHKFQRDNREKDAMKAISDRQYWVAQTALLEAAQHDAVITEFEFQLECMEVQ